MERGCTNETRDCFNPDSVCGLICICGASEEKTGTLTSSYFFRYPFISFLSAKGGAAQTLQRVCFQFKVSLKLRMVYTPRNLLFVIFFLTWKGGKHFVRPQYASRLWWDKTHFCAVGIMRSSFPPRHYESWDYIWEEGERGKEKKVVICPPPFNGNKASKRQNSPLCSPLFMTA